MLGLLPLPDYVRSRSPLCGKFMGVYWGGIPEDVVKVESVLPGATGTAGLWTYPFEPEGALCKDYFPLVEYLLSLPPENLYGDIHLQAIVLCGRITLEGQRRATVVIPEWGLVLVDMAYVRATLDYEARLGEGDSRPPVAWQAKLMHRASRICHEIAHLADYHIVGEDFKMVDDDLQDLLPGWKWGGTLTLAQSFMLPNYSAYPASGAAELRAEWLCELWVLFGSRQRPGAPEDGQTHDDILVTGTYEAMYMERTVRRQALVKADDYWSRRATDPLPSLAAFLTSARQGSQSPAACSALGRISGGGKGALEAYRRGLLREGMPDVRRSTTPAPPSAGLREGSRAEEAAAPAEAAAARSDAAVVSSEAARSEVSGAATSGTTTTSGGATTTAGVPRAGSSAIAKLSNVSRQQRHRTKTQEREVELPSEVAELRAQPSRAKAKLIAVGIEPERPSSPITKRPIETRRQEPQRYSRERSQLQKQTRSGHFQNPLLSLQIRLGPPIFRRAATVWGRREKKQKGERRQRGVSTGVISQIPSWPGWTNDPRPGQKVLARNIRPAPALHS